MQIVKRAGVPGLLVAAIAAWASAASAGEAVPLCDRAFTICIWDGGGAHAPSPGQLKQRRRLAKFLRLAASLGKTVQVHYSRARVLPVASDESCATPPDRHAELEALAAALGGVLENAKGSAGEDVRLPEAPGCGHAYTFHVDTDFRKASRVCGFAIDLADRGWPPDRNASVVYRPLDWNGNALLVGDGATVRLTPQRTGPEKPVAWIQLIGAEGATPGSVGLLADRIEFAVTEPIEIRIGCGIAAAAANRGRTPAPFTDRSAADFQALLDANRKGIGPEAVGLDVDALTAANDDPRPCGTGKCASLSIVFDRE